MKKPQPKHAKRKNQNRKPKAPRSASGLFVYRVSDEGGIHGPTNPCLLIATETESPIEAAIKAQPLLQGQNPRFIQLIGFIDA